MYALTAHEHAPNHRGTTYDDTKSVYSMLQMSKPQVFLELFYETQRSRLCVHHN